MAYVAAGAAVRAGAAQAAPVLRAGAGQVNRALAEANLRAADGAIRHVARRGYDVVSGKKKEGYRYLPRGQDLNSNPDEIVRLMPGKRSPQPAQQRLYIAQTVKGRGRLDGNGQVVQGKNPAREADAHIPAWRWIWKETVGGKSTRP
jgi:hypothetical protein